MIGLTRRQADCFAFIKTHITETDTPPSFDEMCTHLGLRSKSGIHRILSALEERGLIRRLKSRARAIEVLDPKNGALYFLTPSAMEWVRYGADRRSISVETMLSDIVSVWVREESNRTRRPVESITA